MFRIEFQTYDELRIFYILYSMVNIYNFGEHSKKLQGIWISFQAFFVWALLMIVHTWNSTPLPSNLL